MPKKPKKLTKKQLEELASKKIYNFIYRKRKRRRRTKKIRRNSFKKRRRRKT